MSKQPLTLERHKQIGPELQEMYNYLLELQCELSHHYPLKFADLVERVWRWLPYLRQELENKCFRENPALTPKEVFDIYHHIEGSK